MITGAPGSGKTTLIAELARRGFRVEHDPAREIIEERLRKGETKLQVRMDETAHRRLVIEEMLSRAQKLPPDTTIFFDYGILDNIAFARLFDVKLDPDLFVKAMMYRYKHVFLLASFPLERDDPVRREDEETQAALNRLIRKTYSELGYRLIDIPAISVQARADLVTRHVTGVRLP